MQKFGINKFVYILIKPDMFIQSLLHLEILGAKMIGTQTHNTKIQKVVYWSTI